jgi:DNA-binding protein HU-beta
MTKADLIDAVHEAVGEGHSKKAVGELVDATFEALKDAIRTDRFSYPGFGTFTVKETKARDGRNPQHRSLRTRSKRLRQLPKQNTERSRSVFLVFACRAVVPIGDPVARHWCVRSGSSYDSSAKHAGELSSHRGGGWPANGEQYW